MPTADLKKRLQASGLVLASGNHHKIVEFKRMLDPLAIEVVSAADLGLDLDVAETEDTFQGNAALKARAYFQHAGRPVIADDSGLVVDALAGAPGVYSARYGGPGLDDVGRRRFLLAELERLGVPQTAGARAARFVCVLALCLDSEELRFYEGKAEGSILAEERGQGGFGYDPVFLDPGSDRSFAELSPADKDARSHRGAALRAFVSELAL